MPVILEDDKLKIIIDFLNLKNLKVIKPGRVFTNCYLITFLCYYNKSNSLELHGAGGYAGECAVICTNLAQPNPSR
jgi:hypothetical protein